MRIITAILHMLIGLLAIACVAGFVSWAWPGVAQPVWTIAYIAMVVLVVTSIIRVIRRSRMHV